MLRIFFRASAKPGTPPPSHALNRPHLKRRSAPPPETALRAVSGGSAPRRGASPPVQVRSTTVSLYCPTVCQNMRFACLTSVPL